MVTHKGKGKGKANPRTGHVGPEWEMKYGFNISLTSVPDGGGRITPRPGRFTPGKGIRYRLCRKLVVSQGRSGRVQKISAQQGFDLRIVRRVARRYPATYNVEWDVKVIMNNLARIWKEETIDLHVSSKFVWSDYREPWKAC